MALSLAGSLALDVQNVPLVGLPVMCGRKVEGGRDNEVWSYLINP